MPYEERARYLFDAARIMRERKHEFSALMVFEAGKTWPEADADTAEAIDFLEFYGREMLRLGPPQPTIRDARPEVELCLHPAGRRRRHPALELPRRDHDGHDRRDHRHRQHGRPQAGQRHPRDRGLARRALQRRVAPAAGRAQFPARPRRRRRRSLVDHPKTRFIAFTGSKEVGIRIFQRAAQVQPGQIWLKRTILEMGGKDAILVDETADLDAAAAGIVAAAFGFQGQKCSACSRAIIVEDVYDALLAKIVERTQAIQVGDPAEGPACGHGAGDRRAPRWTSTWSTSRSARARAGWLSAGRRSRPRRAATSSSRRSSRTSRPPARLAQEEIFGPVLAVIKATDFDDGLAIANNTEYGLTGAVYSMRRDRLERARQEFHVGQPVPQPQVHGRAGRREPFGGFNMSGTDSKAGGSDYLLLFTQAKVVSEPV